MDVGQVGVALVGTAVPQREGSGLQRAGHDLGDQADDEQTSGRQGEFAEQLSNHERGDPNKEAWPAQAGERAVGAQKSRPWPSETTWGARRGKAATISVEAGTGDPRRPAEISIALATAWPPK